MTTSGKQIPLILYLYFLCIKHNYFLAICSQYQRLKDGEKMCVEKVNKGRKDSSIVQESSDDTMTCQSYSDSQHPVITIEPALDMIDTNTVDKQLPVNTDDCDKSDRASNDITDNGTDIQCPDDDHQQCTFFFYLYVENVSITFLLNWLTTNDHRYVPLVIGTSRSFPHSRLTIGFVTRVTRWVPLVEQELLTITIQKHVRSPQAFGGVALSLVFCVVVQ